MAVKYHYPSPLMCISLGLCMSIVQKQLQLHICMHRKPKEMQECTSLTTKTQHNLVFCHLQMPTNSLLNLSEKWFLSKQELQCKGCLKVPTTFVALQIFERILYIWAIRHPASGYVQGINDLVTPFFVVFLSAYVGMCILKKHEIPYCFLNGLSHKCHSAQTPICNHFTCNHLSKIPKSLSQSSTPFGSFLP